MHFPVWLPHPRLSAILLGTWLLLQNSFAPGTILLGSALALVIPRFATRVWPQPVRLCRPGQWLRYLGQLLWDIVIANLQVAWLVLTRPPAQLHPALIALPLDLDDEFAIAVLAATITLTPGTISIELIPDQHQLRIHCLDVADEAALIAMLKSRYEAPLKAMFASC